LIKRVILTSSAVTLIPIQWVSSSDTETVFTGSLYLHPIFLQTLILYPERDINSNPTRPFHSAMEAYWASKALTRIASKNFMTDNMPSFELINLLPSVVIGPDPLSMSVETLMSGTRALALGQVLGNKQDPLVGVQVHVADVARAHIDALAPSVPGNAEYILTSDTPAGIEWDSVKEVVETHFPGELAAGRLSLQYPMPTRPFTIDASATEKAFGWKFRNYAETMQGLIGQYLELSGKPPVST